MSDEKGNNDIPSVVIEGKDALLRVVVAAITGVELTLGHSRALGILTLALDGMKTPDVGRMREIARTLSESERKQACAFLGLFEQLGHACLGIVLKTAVEEGDKFAIPIPDGSGTHIWLGDGEPPVEQIKAKQQQDASGGDILAAVKALLEGTTEDGTEVHVIGMGSLEEVTKAAIEHVNSQEKVKGFKRLQDDYGDPIQDIARKLAKMPGAKQPKLPPKKLPEC